VLYKANGRGCIAAPPSVIFSYITLAFYSSDAGKHLTLDGFKESAATGGYIAYLVGKAEFVNAGHGVAATYERERAVVGGIYNGIGDSA